MKSFKKFIKENKKLSTKQFADEYTSKSFFNNMTDDEAVKFFIDKTGKSRTSAINYFKNWFGKDKFMINEETENQLQDVVINELNRKLQLILKHSAKLENSDFKNFFAGLAKEIEPIFSEEGFDVVNLEKPEVIIRSGERERNGEDFKIASDNVEFDNVVLNVGWSKDTDKDDFILTNLKVIKS